MNRLFAALVLVAMSAGIAFAQDPAAAQGPPAPAVLTRGPDSKITYKLLATLKTGTMQKELNEAAAEGFRFAGVMGGDTAGGNQVVVILSRTGEGSGGRYAYRLLATNKTSTMQKEIQAAGDEGFEYRGQTVYNSAFGGDQVLVILEKDRDAPVVSHEYLLLATNKTGTMQKELADAADAGFEFVGLTVGQTSGGGNEIVTILRRVRTGPIGQ